MVLGTDRLALAVANSREVAEILLRRGAVDEAGVLFKRHFPSNSACIIADENTWGAAGAAIESALRAQGIQLRSHVLAAKPKPKPSVELADELARILAADDAIPVAVGSGVINDMVKHAAFSLGRPYLCVATAVSMDGYTSAGAPLSVRGFKKTIQCKPPVAVLADLDVLGHAPAAMTGWGYSDLAGKVAAGADWLLADALGIEAVDGECWGMVQDELRHWLADPASVKRGDAQALSGLFSGLAMVGFAMERHGSSRPASGSDHQIAHLWEMEGLSHGGEPVSHGACVAIGTVSVVALYGFLLSSDIVGLDVDAVVAAAADFDTKVAIIREGLGAGELAERAIEETRAKHLDAKAQRERLSRLLHVWPVLSDRLRQQLPALDELRGWLALAGAPSRAADIGVSRQHLHASILNARFLRSRYTVLDTLEETGLLARAAHHAADIV
jgi:glycerol-1-phosphate dehydrogenase [NAD(P)+]